MAAGPKSADPFLLLFSASFLNDMGHMYVADRSEKLLQKYRVPQQDLLNNPAVVHTAPEILMGLNHSNEVDIWSAGVMLYVMLFGAYPFLEDSELMDQQAKFTVTHRRYLASSMQLIHLQYILDVCMFNKISCVVSWLCLYGSCKPRPFLSLTACPFEFPIQPASKFHLMNSCCQMALMPRQHVWTDVIMVGTE